MDNVPYWVSRSFLRRNPDLELAFPYFPEMPTLIPRACNEKIPELAFESSQNLSPEMSKT